MAAFSGHLVNKRVKVKAISKQEAPVFCVADYDLWGSRTNWWDDWELDPAAGNLFSVESTLNTRAPFFHDCEMAVMIKGFQ